MFIGPADIMEGASFILSMGGLALVAVPLCDALAAAVEFANRPAHRVTPAPPWTFFDREFRRRLRKRAVVWLLIFPVNVGLIAALAARMGNFGIQYGIGDSLTIGLQCGFFTLSGILAQAGFVAVLAPRMARKGYLLGTSIVLAVALFALTIALAGYPPPSCIYIVRTASNLSNGSPAVFVKSVRFGREYVYTAFAYLAFCVAAWGWFMATRKTSRLFSVDG